MRTIGSASIGSSLYELLPEDDHDRQPYVDDPRGLILAADARVDNRNELMRSLDLRAGLPISDSELLFRGYLEWGDDFFSKVFGDFAVAIWDSRQQCLTLARDHAGQRPLYYHFGEGWVAFASMPVGLKALPELPSALNEQELALYLTGARRMGPQTYFRDIARVEPSHIVKITRSNLRSDRWWHLPGREVRFRNQNDYVEAFREQLDLATKARLRRARGSVAVHLSGGLDSSAVASTAGRIASSEPLTALTSAPRRGFDGSIPAFRVADETAYAAQTAALYDNIEHVVLRTSGLSPTAVLERDAGLYQQPIAQPCNYTWLCELNDAARDRGASVVLTGASGNLTLSAGGPSVLADFLAGGRWGRWLREARASVGKNGWRLRGVLKASFSPWLPPSLWNAFNWAPSTEAAESEFWLLNDQWRTLLGSLRRGSVDRDRGSRLNRWRMLQTRDSGNYRKGALARWGLDERDPTADRRLTEFCLSLPPEQLLSDGINRRLARLSLSDRIPEAILNAPRGYQFADWFETIDPASLEKQLQRLDNELGGSSVVDIKALRHLARSWPDSGWGSLAVIGKYRITLLRGLAALAFERHCRSIGR